MTITTTKLIIKKDDFEKQIKERISKGIVLLNFRVTIQSRKNGRLGESNNYNETEKKDFLIEYNKWKKYNVELLKQSFNTSGNEYLKEYEEAERDRIWSDFVVERKDDIQKQITVLESLIERLSLIPTNDEIVKQDNKSEKKITNKIFIVHGHDNEIKQIVARTLTQIKLEPIILHEQADQGRTIIEKFEQNSSEVNFAIILLTADDIGKAEKETDYKSRARQNVVFEMGYFIGKLGRKKVFLLLENGVDKPGDLDGIVYVPIDNADGWKLKLVKELIVAGYNVTADDL
ncbi:TIR domain-containing protein [Flavobacterium columnare]|uniref:TIR domain-containing protein n=1 Tax=Flavobacterium columnare TaxID=996 RepID=UPI001F09C168|nr:nucleotide-binding protein [Flavobacterium columnare]